MFPCLIQGEHLEVVLVFTHLAVEHADDVQKHYLVKFLVSAGDGAQLVCDPAAVEQVLGVFIVKKVTVFPVKRILSEGCTETDEIKP